jgi:hypothetical protein
MQRVLKMNKQLAEQVYDYSRAAVPTDATLSES